MSTVSPKDMNEKVEESATKQVLRKELEMMHREMEIATYATNQKGQPVRVTPKAQSLERTLKRKSLEKDDAKARAIEVTAEERKILDTSRMRGAKAALALGEVSTESNDILFMGQKQAQTSDQQYHSDSSSSSNCDDVSIGMEEEDEDVELSNAEEDVEDDEEETADDDLETSKDGGVEKALTRPEKKSRFSASEDEQKQSRLGIKKKKGDISGIKMARTMYRLKNFSSRKLAEKHGDALGAHARGQQRQAVSKLSEVAEAAPIAPQLYSSLGLVYENMLEESEQELFRRKKLDSMNGEKTISASEIIPIVKLGQKAYGSYHVAAVLCKKDFTLWVRAGDAAWDIADLYNEAMRDPTIPNAMNCSFRSEELKWLTEAKEDYEAADKLKPPGITVPAKLASIHMKLGNFAEALTILTDLRNSSFRLSLAASKRCKMEGGMRTRTELEKSYTAWLLYADLMLRIGYECSRWNNRCSNVENYMFKRWLKKHGSTFDWKERRLHALCYALQAAAGSICCQKLVGWLKLRANHQNDNAEEAVWKIDNYETNDEDEKAESEVEIENEINGENVINLCQNSIKEKNVLKNGCSSEGKSESDFMVKKTNMLDKHRLELENFDRETAEMSLDSSAMVVRNRERDLLLKQHRHALVSFVGDHQIRKCNEDLTSESSLPITASCGVVCDIASQLIRLSVEMNLFRAGQLTAEAVSAYLKQRYARSQKRKRNLERCRSRINASEKDILLVNQEDHDELHIQIEDEIISDDDVILSDEDEIDNSDDKLLFLSLQNGVLPPDIKFLYALSLLGEGRSKSAALKMLSSVNDLDSESAMPRMNADFFPDKSWVLFQSTTKGKLKRPAALMMLLDLLRRSTNLEESCAEQVLHLLEKNPLISSPFLFEDDGTGGNIKTRAIFFAAISRLKLYAAISASETKTLTESIETILSIINKIERAHKDLWFGASSNDGPSHTTVLMIEIISKAFSFISQLLLERNGRLSNLDLIERLTKSLNNLVGIIYDLHLPYNVSFVTKVPQGFSETWSAFPCLSSWQDGAMMKLSKRCFLLCAGMNVAQFSGWGDEDFNLETLTERCSFGFFGVNVFGRHMTGHLHPRSEKFLSTLWRAIPHVLPNLPQLNFEDNLDKAKATPWHEETFEKFHDLSNKARIATLGEDFGLDLLLSLAALNMFKASKETSPSGKDELIKIAMSIIFPATQFCLDVDVWDSSIGQGASDETAGAWDYYLKERSNLDEITQQHQVPVTARARSKPIYTSVTTAALKSASVSSRGNFVPKTWKPISSTFIPVPVSILLQEWKTGQDAGTTASTPMQSDSLLPSRVSMKKVDFAMKQLRSCFTVQALQKASIRVAECLLEVAVDPLCHNPFLCLSHAAIFAGHGPRGGNSDEPFKRRLPNSPEQCTPLQALLILGRADCLRAVAFTDEAIFLCSYVARVVARHRDRTVSDCEWNSQWCVVGVQTYIVCASIDTSIKSFLTDMSSASVWEEDVNQELAYSKLDAQRLSGLTPMNIDQAAGRNHAPEDQYNEDTYICGQNRENDHGDYVNDNAEEQQLLFSERLPTDAQRLRGLTPMKIDHAAGRNHAPEDQYNEDTYICGQNRENDHGDYLNHHAEEQQLLFSERLPTFLSTSFDSYDVQSDNESQIEIEAV